jgi:hypothetical protein
VNAHANTHTRMQPNSEAWLSAPPVAWPLNQALTVPERFLATVVSNMRRVGSLQVRTLISKREGRSGDSCHHAGPSRQMAPTFISRATIRAKTCPQSLDANVGDSLHEVDVHNRGACKAWCGTYSKFAGKPPNPSMKTVFRGESRTACVLMKGFTKMEK